MNLYYIKNTAFLRKVLWIDFLCGSSVGVGGLIFHKELINIVGLSDILILWIAKITLLYALSAMAIALMKTLSVPLVRIQVYANWFWTLISIGLLFFHFSDAQIFGKIFLILQILVVGGLAYIEGSQIVRK
ncbi:hypothetical protein AD998_05665 [bacterium 336/3]|nr:hypothetical protein AD998_05665 [bacterium 336/3]